MAAAAAPDVKASTSDAQASTHRAGDSMSAETRWHRLAAAAIRRTKYFCKAEAFMTATGHLHPAEMLPNATCPHPVGAVKCYRNQYAGWRTCARCRARVDYVPLQKAKQNEHDRYLRFNVSTRAAAAAAMAEPPTGRLTEEELPQSSLEIVDLTSWTGAFEFVPMPVRRAGTTQNH